MSWFAAAVALRSSSTLFTFIYSLGGVGAHKLGSDSWGAVAQNYGAKFVTLFINFSLLFCDSFFSRLLFKYNVRFYSSTKSYLNFFTRERNSTPQLTQDGEDTSLKLFLFYCYFRAFQYIFFWKSTFFTAACGCVGVDVLSIQRCSTSSSSSLPSTLNTSFMSIST